MLWLKLIQWNRLFLISTLGYSCCDYFFIFKKKMFSPSFLNFPYFSMITVLLDECNMVVGSFFNVLIGHSTSAKLLRGQIKVMMVEESWSYFQQLLCMFEKHLPCNIIKNHKSPHNLNLLKIGHVKLVMVFQFDPSSDTVQCSFFVNNCHGKK